MRTVVTVVTVLAAIGAAPGVASAQAEPGTCDLSDPFPTDDFELVQCAALAADCPTTTWQSGSTTTCSDVDSSPTS